MFKVPEKYRVTDNSYSDLGCIATQEEFLNNGDFIIQLNSGAILRIRASDGDNWEHVSVSIANRERCPTWREMCIVKNMFWSDDDLVVQFHPPKSEYINMHPYCLHLWRYAGTNDYCHTPNKLLIGA